VGDPTCAAEAYVIAALGYNWEPSPGAEWTV
jgi:hypothetical protein